MAGGGKEKQIFFSKTPPGKNQVDIRRLQSLPLRKLRGLRVSVTGAEGRNHSERETEKGYHNATARGKPPDACKHPRPEVVRT